MNFFEYELPVFVCRKSLGGFLRIYDDTGKYFSLTDQTNAFHFLCRSFCVHFQIKLKKRLIPLINGFKEELRPTQELRIPFRSTESDPSSEDFRMLSL